MKIQIEEDKEFNGEKEFVDILKEFLNRLDKLQDDSEKDFKEKSLDPNRSHRKWYLEMMTLKIRTRQMWNDYK